MTAKEYLSKVKKTNIKISTKLSELSELQSLAYTVKAINTNEKVQSSHINNSGKVIDRIIDMQNEINSEIDSLVELKAEARNKINKIENETYKQLLINYYINCRNFKQCTKILLYSQNYLEHCLKYAIAEFVKFNSEYQ